MAGKHAVVAGSMKNKALAAASRLMPEPAKAAVHGKQVKPEDA